MLLHCARVLSFCHRSDTGIARDEFRERSRSALTWTDAWEPLYSWFLEQQHQDLQPLLELHDIQHGETTLIFCRSAGAFCHQLYHTSALLLLNRKPRTLNIAASPHWHRRRICGIARGNQAAEGWDLLLVQSLIIAGKSLTHPDQHRDVMDTLHRAECLTGWTAKVQVDCIKSGWALTNG